MEGKNPVLNKNLEAVFNPVYENYFPGIYRYIFRIVGNQEEASQMTQQAFLNFYGYLCSHASINNTKALVFRIASNICRDYLRKNKRARNVSREGMILGNSSEQPERELLKKERAMIFRKALRQLSPRDQQCLLLYQEGFSYSEIAVCMRMKENSVGKVLSRATEKLSRIIRNGDKR